MSRPRSLCLLDQIRGSSPLSQVHCKESVTNQLVFSFERECLEIFPLSWRVAWSTSRSRPYLVQASAVQRMVSRKVPRLACRESQRPNRRGRRALRPRTRRSRLRFPLRRWPFRNEPKLCVPPFLGGSRGHVLVESPSTVPLGFVDRTRRSHHLLPTRRWKTERGILLNSA